MESFTRINITERDGEHSFYFFHVDVKGYDTKKQKRVYTALKAAFPEPQYNIDVTRWECGGKTITL